MYNAGNCTANGIALQTNLVDEGNHFFGRSRIGAPHGEPLDVGELDAPRVHRLMGTIMVIGAIVAAEAA